SARGRGPADALRRQLPRGRTRPDHPGASSRLAWLELELLRPANDERGPQLRPETQARPCGQPLQETPAGRVRATRPLAVPVERARLRVCPHDRSAEGGACDVRHEDVERRAPEQGDVAGTRWLLAAREPPADGRVARHLDADRELEPGG